jgi:hypothetical protein
MATRKITTSLFALALAAAPLRANAQQAAVPDPMIVGLGTVKGGCGKWIAALQNSAADASYVSWVFGYLSGVNAFNVVIAGKVDFLDGYDGWSLAPWAKNWCRAHPLDTVASAALAEVTELANRHQQGNS